MKTHKVQHFYVSSKFKAAVVESFHRRFQNMLYLYLQGNPKKSMKNLMKFVIHNYNRLPHSYHGQRPIDVDGNLAVDLLLLKISEREFETKESERLKKSFKFKIGQTVRATRLRRIFDKGYRGVFTEEVFVVADRLMATSYIINEQGYRGKRPSAEYNLQHLAQDGFNDLESMNFTVTWGGGPYLLMDDNGWRNGMVMTEDTACFS